MNVVIVGLQIAVSLVMIGIAVVGIIQSERGAWGAKEPQLVLRLSWLALLFGGLTSLVAVGG